MDLQINKIIEKYHDIKRRKKKYAKNLKLVKNYYKRVKNGAYDLT